MRIRILTFSDRGEEIAERLCEKLFPVDIKRCGEGVSLSSWTRESFYSSDALIFVGACGIAVRAIAPYVKDKATDPAVVVVDELGQYAIPILSGHIGGANALSRRVAQVLGGTAVITTATDISNVFAIDEWAAAEGLHIMDTSGIKTVSARLLDGGTVSVKSSFPISGQAPRGISLTDDDGADVHISTAREGTEGAALVLVPRIAALGVGCRRGASLSSIEKCFLHIRDMLGIFEEAFFGVFSIDLKSGEPGLLEFCEKHGLPFTTYEADRLRQVAGDFEGSDFVREVTGVDNVCERSALLGAGDGGRMVLKKTVCEGVTMAVAFAEIALKWE